MNKKLLTMGLAALLMAGCSSDDVVGEGDTGGTSAVKGYVGLTITMPTGTGSRAGSYDDGAAGEYKVNDVTLVFSKWNGATHTIVQVTKFTSTDWQEDTGSDDITSASVLPVVPVADAEAKSVLVLVNSSDVFDVETSTYEAATGGNTVDDAGSIKPKGNPVAYTTIEELEAVQTLDADKYYGTPRGWFMANASIENGAAHIDSHDNHKQLVTITPQKSKEAAMADAKNNVIYVERAVAKVSLRFKSNDAPSLSETFDCTGDGFTDDDVIIDGWALDITNKSTFPLRRIASTPAWSLNRFAPTTGNPQRYEWSVDNNYSSYNPATDFNRVNAATESCANSLYCLENTFNIGNMNQDGTTRAILRGQYVPKDILQTEVNANGIFRLGESVKFYSKADMLAKVKDAALAAGVIGAASADVEQPKVGKNDFSFTGSEGNKIVIKDNEGNPISLTTDQQTAIKGMLGQLTYYKQGYCYYPVRIRHFADAADPADGVSAWAGEDSYDTDERWLGRYGVVRNNSYVINVTSVKAPGSPTIPDPTQNIDDEEFYYIQATVKVLSWTKRSQSVDL